MAIVNIITHKKIQNNNLGTATTLILFDMLPFLLEQSNYNRAVLQFAWHFAVQQTPNPLLEIRIAVLHTLLICLEEENNQEFLKSFSEHSFCDLVLQYHVGKNINEKLLQLVLRLLKKLAYKEILLSSVVTIINDPIFYKSCINQLDPCTIEQRTGLYNILFTNQTWRDVPDKNSHHTDYHVKFLRSACTKTCNK